VALGSTQLLTELSTRNYSGGKGRPARKADNLTFICEPIISKMWDPRHLTTLWASTTSRAACTLVQLRMQCDTWITLPFFVRGVLSGCLN
jgi:hypothetical protein